jgi:hypothetical protein
VFEELGILMKQVNWWENIVLNIANNKVVYGALLLNFNEYYFIFFIDIKGLMNKVQLILRIKANFCLVKKP